MGLSYHIKFLAPAKTSATALEAFLRIVERKAKRLGVEPTVTLNAKFDTSERKQFSMRLTYGMTLQSDKLKGVVLAADGQFRRHDPEAGEVRVLPKQAVVLVLTGADGREGVMGFFRYPATLKDRNGADICRTGAGNAWSQDFITGADPRFRQLAKLFRDAGYVAFEKDEFVANLATHG
jgi:hypothetical protein